MSFFGIRNLSRSILVYTDTQNSSSRKRKTTRGYRKYKSIFLSTPSRTPLHLILLPQSPSLLHPDNLVNTSIKCMDEFPVVSHFVFNVPSKFTINCRNTRGNLTKNLKKLFERLTKHNSQGLTVVKQVQLSYTQRREKFKLICPKNRNFSERNVYRSTDGFYVTRHVLFAVVRS